jgi:isopentenyl phosphate kinase
MTETVFLKLGGSMITDKTRVEQVLPDVLARAASEVASALRDAPGLRLVLGHGSGSFGHVAARRYGTRNGVQGPEAWMGFVRVAEAAARLNRLVVADFLAAGVPAWSVQPSAGGWCADGQISQWQGEPVEMALARGLVPLIYGDVMLDEAQGGTIASTEELFAWLVARLRPARVILAGTVDGVYSADPLADASAEPWPLITPASLPSLQASLGGSHGVDVTGGMLSKVTEMCALVEAYPQLEVRLVSGLRPGALYASLLGLPEAGGTVISAR